MVCCAYASGKYIFIGEDNVFSSIQEVLPAIKTKRRRRPQKQKQAAKTPPAPKVEEVDELEIVFSQCGGSLLKEALSPEEESESHSHWRMRCNASHDRRKTRFLTERRRQVVRY